MLKHCRPNILARGHLSLLHRSGGQLVWRAGPEAGQPVALAHTWFSGPDPTDECLILVAITAWGMFGYDGYTSAQCDAPNHCPVCEIDL